MAIYSKFYEQYLSVVNFSIFKLYITINFSKNPDFNIIYDGIKKKIHMKGIKIFIIQLKKNVIIPIIKRHPE